MLQKRPLPEELGDGYTGSGQYFKAFSSEAKSRHPERNSAGDLVALGEAEAARVGAAHYLGSGAGLQQPLAVPVEGLTSQYRAGIKAASAEHAQSAKASATARGAQFAMPSQAYTVL